MNIPRFLTLTAASLALACAAFAADPAPQPERQDITLADGRVLKNAKILNHTPALAAVLHADGMSSVPLDQLPKDVQERLGYSSEKAASYTAQQEATRAKYAAEEKEKARLAELEKTRVTLFGRVDGVGVEGVLIYCEEPYSPPPRPIRADRLAQIGGGSAAYAPPRAPASASPPPPPSIYGTFCIRDYPDRGKLGEGDKISVVVYPAGTIESFTYPGGSRITAQYRAFSMSPPPAK
ncbi:hypothetical protein [Geminisphaera colitermitum]|uniref:hypothetical protein n=1 Tax=Geminisphaera colitermitum TaxID=1148786 RepID=UPI000158C723|nr:hypothetical protein [Geminisphaera colitermitum]